MYRSFKQEIVSDAVPPAAGPSSSGCRAGDFYYYSGLLGLKPDGTTYGASAAEQAWQALGNLLQLLAVGNLDASHVVKTTVFLTDLADLATVDEVYAQFFTPPLPTRSTVQVAALPMDLKVGFEAVAWYHM